MGRQLHLRTAVPEDADWIHDLRHRVYARELGQHASRPDGRLSDGLDGDNVYLVATRGAVRIGFVSVTPPWLGRFGLDKYLERDELPLLREADTFEVRILTVEPEERTSAVAPLLMYAALRWIASRGGRHVVAMGRTEVLGLYLAAGLRPVGRTVQCGAVSFEVLTGGVDALTRSVLDRHPATLERLRTAVDWRLDVPFAPGPDGCEHGGASFTAVGTDFRTLHRRRRIVAADVLDAWFPPAPEVSDALTDDPSWLARTSPPADAAGLIAEIAAVRRLPRHSLCVGAGSSDLIYRALGQLLTPESRVLLIDPGYGEYAHVTERVIGCHVDRLRLRRADDWRIDPRRLTEAVADGRYDLVVVVNPNNPTGRHAPAADLRTAIDAAPDRTRWWIDETYLGYVDGEGAEGAEDPGVSLAPLAATDPRVIVCTSLSKMYALSGLRAAYLVAAPDTTARLRRWTPPWPVSLPAQRAAVAALGAPAYYRERRLQTRALRHRLALELTELDEGVLVEEGVANFVNLTLPADGPSAAQFVEACRHHDVYLRDLSPLSALYEGRTVRIAVKDAAENARIVAACQAALDVLVPPVPLPGEPVTGTAR
ncbi:MULTISPECIES: aminotransferase class I/II-fold pyridoxal phosphate-dependent enzyme [unclassified Streptomyces]|uniref:histidinol-phosphate aminotransferase family protein n=1 Tax=unclassified Streptomyces TaxID=2593676 RepID=UPI000DBA2B8A|nr:MULTISPECIES: aminotransferase class I/II-fold pyridoxal phosphate-dependent enzyme [unclassified Streptomyces]MYT68902.1 aminotransferase class I/II-fold pyridoxal phosphate-dependent enzyme [Streptomyces sp. SID8367]RAJ82407.1 histidinol-phosphate/aromatic aminotransferase/cobyric acid decarboxylase-like protein [Streptomyces sp. PsTaAH-137]